MNIVLYGATGMVGGGVLRECLADLQVGHVIAVGRTRCDVSHPKLRNVVLPDLTDYSAVTQEFAAADACFFCLGQSSIGMTEADYRRVTLDFAAAAAGALLRSNPAMTFVYVSGAGTDSTEHGRSMWARVKGRTENALLALPFKAAYMLRPGVIQPLGGIRSKTRSHRLIYAVLTPFLSTLRRLFPDHVLSTEQIGRVMLSVAKDGYDKRVLETNDIAAVSRRMSQRHGVKRARHERPAN